MTTPIKLCTANIARFKIMPSIVALLQVAAHSHLGRHGRTKAPIGIPIRRPRIESTGPARTLAGTAGMTSSANFYPFANAR